MVNNNIDNVSIKKFNSNTWEISHIHSGLRYSYWTDNPQIEDLINQLLEIAGFDIES